MQMLQVRQLCASDARSFRRVRLNGLRLHPDAFGSSWEEEANRSVDRLAEALEAGFVAGCERDGALVGVAGLRRGASLKTRHRGAVWGMYVEPDGRRLGVGGLLLAAVIERARTEIEDLTLTVAAHNQPAISLYRSFGFVEYAVDRRALKIDEEYVDELLMRLNIEDVR
jgi:ribosomal protein S18 acetylase RimI-like enzyme